MRAIAARMKREGKSPEQIRRFFHSHDHGGKDKRHKRRKRGAHRHRRG